MVSITPNLLELDVVSFANFYRRLHNDLYHLLIQQRTTLLHRKNDVVMDLPRTMTCLMNNLISHPAIL